MIDFAKPRIPSTLSMAEALFALAMVAWLMMGVAGLLETEKVGQSLMTLAIPIGYFYIRYFTGWFSSEQAD